MTSEIAYQEKIIRHYQNVWDNECSLYLWDKGPIDKLPFTFRILEFPPNENRKMWTYATCCMSEIEDDNLIELHIFSSYQDDTLIELLTAVAFYHRNTSFLGLNHTINFGRPWQDASLCKYGFVSLPYLDGPNLEQLYIEDNNRTVRFYWLIPITEKELHFKINHGAKALEGKFDNGLDYINPKRKSLA